MSAFTVQLAAYCGMRVPYGEYESLDEARDRVAKRLRYVRNRLECPVAKLDRHEWEVMEPEGCMMVPDFCGILTIREVTKPGVELEEEDCQ
jgi:hypothetical protein